MAVPNRMNFRKSSKGGGIFNPNIYFAVFGNCKQGFLSMKLIQKINFRVQDMLFFNNFIKKNQNTTHFEEGSSGHMYQSKGRFRVSGRGGGPPALELFLKNTISFYCFPYKNCNIIFQK